MQRCALLVTPFVLIGCATPSAKSLSVSHAASFSDTEAPRVEALADPDAPLGTFTDFAPALQAPPRPPPRPRERFTIKGGYYGSSEDVIDDGYIVNVSWMRPVSANFSSEVEIGYLDASGSDGGIDRDVWAIPFMANGRLNVPVGEKIELYGGLGLGSIYYDTEVKLGGGSVSADGFLFAGDAYFGGDIHLGENLYVGLEGKYYVTDNASDLGGGLDAYVVMLTLGFAR